MSVCDKKAIKVLDADTRRIGAYATIWGELDCDSDRMTRKAIEPYVGKGAPLMFWLHGLDDTFGSNVVGVWDEDSFKADDTGLYVEGNVGRDDFGEMAWGLIDEAGSFGLSVGSFWYLVRKKSLADGSKEITNWPLLDISLMEGGKQCVPSARNDIKGDVANILLEHSTKMGLVTTNSPLEISVEATVANGAAVKNISSAQEDVMSERDKAKAVDIESVVANQLEKFFEAKEAQEQAAKAQSEAITAQAQALAAEQLETATKEWEAEKVELEAKAKTAGKRQQPTAPPVAQSGDTRQVQIKMTTPYDRLDTVDLSNRYMLLKSWGKQPSEQMTRTLANRVIELARTEDTLYIKNGEPVKVPAVDWEVLVPRNLDLNEIEAKGEMAQWDGQSDVVSKAGLRQFYEIATKADELVYSTQSGFGDEWVPTLQSAELWRTVRLEAATLGLLPQIDMPSQPYDLSTESTDPTWYTVTEATDESHLVLTGGPFTDSKVATAKVTLSAGKLGGLTYWSEEQEEDGIIAFEPAIRDQYGMSMAHAIDDAIINGDETAGASTANINSIGATLAATSKFVVIDGLRHEPLVTTTGDGFDAGTLAFADFVEARSLMGTNGVFGVDVNNLAYIMDAGTYFKAVQLSQVATVDTFGNQATVHTGQLAAIGGVPIIVSQEIALATTIGNISTTAANNTAGSFLCINRSGIRVGWRRRPRMRVVGLPGAEARYIVASARFDVGFKEAGMVSMGYNVTV